MQSQNRILGLIPARAGSQGLPGKHLKMLDGRPLIQYTIDSALKSKSLNTIALSTDSEDIIAFARKHSEIDIPFVRPAQLASADTPTIHVIQHAINHYENIGHSFDYVCLLQPTTPFRCDDLIDNTIKFLLQSGSESLVTVRKIPTKYHPFWSFEMIENTRVNRVAGSSQIISRRQDLPQTFYRDGQIYIASTKIIKDGWMINNDTIGFLNECGPDVNIDTMDDWNQAEIWLNNGK